MSGSEETRSWVCPNVAGLGCGRSRTCHWNLALIYLGFARLIASKGSAICQAQCHSCLSVDEHPLRCFATLGVYGNLARQTMPSRLTGWLMEVIADPCVRPFSHCPASQSWNFDRQLYCSVDSSDPLCSMEPVSASCSMVGCYCCCLISVMYQPASNPLLFTVYQMAKRSVCINASSLLWSGKCWARC